MLSQINFQLFFRAVIIFLVSSMQALILPYLSFGQAIGNIILVVLVIFIFRKEYLKAFYWALIAGVILDLSLGVGFGPYLVSYLLIFSIVYFWQEKILSENIYLFAIITVFIASIIFDIVFIVTAKWIGQNLSLSIFWTLILKQAAYNTILLAIVYPIYYYFEKRLFSHSEIKLPTA